MNQVKIGFSPFEVDLNDGTHLYFWYANNRGRGRDNCTIIRSTDSRAARSAKQAGVIAVTKTGSWRGKVNFSTRVRASLGL